MPRPTIPVSDRAYRTEHGHPFLFFGGSRRNGEPGSSNLGEVRCRHDARDEAPAARLHEDDLLGPGLTNTDVDRAVETVEVRAIIRGFREDELGQHERGDSGYDEVHRLATAFTDPPPAPVPFVSRMLIEGRSDATRDLPGELRGCEAVRQLHGAEMIDDRVEDRSGNLTQGVEGRVLPGKVLEWRSLREPLPGLPALDEVTVTEVPAAGLFEDRHGHDG